MDQPAITIGADGVDTEAIMADIRQRVSEKTARGDYADPRIARAERHNLRNLTDEAFLDYYFSCLREAIVVDINDFEIVERRRRFSGLFVRLKRAIWSLLRFYTYRLWSQQNQVNGLLFASLEATEQEQKSRIAALEARIKDLEATLARNA